MTPTDRRQRITEICELAAQLRPEDREAFVEGECRGDRALVYDVHTCLTLSISGAELSGDAAEEEVEGPSTPPPFQRIGRYEVTGNIGSGGSGHVYSAVDRAVGRVVAIKVLNTPQDASLVQRFRAEAKTVANLHHKNIVTVHEFGEQDGVPYLVMEYLNGTTLLELIKRRTLSLLEKLEIMSEVAEGLSYAHERGITHRDVKPANIMRLTDGSVKIMDFGIARLGAQGNSRLTQVGLMVGSLMYMAPEQFNGVADAVTDVFGYGVTFYELLTGGNPYASADPVVILFRVSNTDLPPLRSAAPECPEALERILTRTVARNREERYSSLSDVLADIRGVLSDLRRAAAGKLYAEAAALFANGQWDAAKSAVRKALSFDPMHAEARGLRSTIEEALRRRDSAARAQSLIEQLEGAVRDGRLDEADGMIEGIRELGALDSQLQARVDRAASQIRQSRRGEELLASARAGLERGDLPEALSAAAELVKADPGNSMANNLLQEIQSRIAVGEAERQVEDEAARIEALILGGEAEQALALLKDFARTHPGFGGTGALRARAEGEKARQEIGRRLAQGIARANALFKGGLFDLAIAKVDALLAEFPDDPELKKVRASAMEKVAGERRRVRILEVKLEAERLMAAEQYGEAVALLDSTIAEQGDDWELTRLHLQATVASNTAREKAEAEEREHLAKREAATQEDAAVAQWKQEIGRLEVVLATAAPLGAAPAQPATAPPAAPPNALQETAPPPVLALTGIEAIAALPARPAVELPSAPVSSPVSAVSAAAPPRAETPVAIPSLTALAPIPGLAAQPAAMMPSARVSPPVSEPSVEPAPASGEAPFTVASLTELAPIPGLATPHAMAFPPAPIAPPIPAMPPIVESVPRQAYSPAAPAPFATLAAYDAGESTVAGIRSEATIELPSPVPPKRRKSSMMTWIAAAFIACAILVLVLVVVRTSKQRSSLVAGLTSSAREFSVGEPVAQGGVRGAAFSMELHAVGGKPPISWEVAEGSLPVGLSLNAGAGRVEGVPDAIGPYVFAVKVSDSAGHSARRAITIEVADPPAVVAASAPDASGAPPANDPKTPAGGAPNGVGAAVPATGSVATPAKAGVPANSGAGPAGNAPNSKAGVAPNSGTTPSGNPTASNPPAPNPKMPMWGTDGGDARRSGYAPYNGPRNPRISWVIEGGNAETNSPLIGPDGRIYVWNGRDHGLRAIENGHTVWNVSLPLNDQVAFGPDGSVQLSSIAGKTHTLDREGASIKEERSDMRLLGLFTWRGRAYSSNGRKPVGTGSTQWFFFRTDDRDAWHVELDGQAGRPVIDENGVFYVGTTKGTIYSISEAATVLWSAPTELAPVVGLAITRDHDVLAAAGAGLYCIRNGQLRWKFLGEGGARAMPPIHDQGGVIYFGKGPDLYAVNGAGKDLWRLRLSEPITGAPAMDRAGHIYVSTATKLYCISDVDRP